MKGGFKESPLKLNAGLGPARRRGTKRRSRNAQGGSPIRRSQCGPRLSLIAETLAAYQPRKVLAHQRLHHRRPSLPGDGSEMPGLACESVRGLPQGGARARSVRDRGIPEAVRGLQGGDQLRGRRAARPNGCGLRINMPFAEINDPKGSVQGRHEHWPHGATATWRSASSRSTNCPTSWASCASLMSARWVTGASMIADLKPYAIQRFGPSLAGKCASTLASIAESCVVCRDQRSQSSR